MALANIRNRPQLFKRVERARFRDLRHANGSGLYMMDDTRPRNRRLQRLNADLGVLALNGNKLRTTRIKLRRTAFVDIHVAFRMTINGGKGRCHCRERQGVCRRPCRHQHDLRGRRIEKRTQTRNDACRHLIGTIWHCGPIVSDGECRENLRRNTAYVVATEIHRAARPSDI